MDKQRQGEIALMLVRMYINKKGIPALDDVKLGINKIAKVTGLSVAELLQFVDGILSDTLKQTV